MIVAALARMAKAGAEKPGEAQETPH